MRKILFSLTILALITLTSCGNKDTYRIIGNIEGAQAGNAILKTADANGNLISKDTATVEDGKFKFNGTEPVPQLYYIFIDGIQNPVTLYVENSSNKIKIKGKANDIANSTIEGSHLTDIYKDFLNSFPNLNSRAQEIEAEIQKASASHDQEAMDDAKKAYNELGEELSQYITNFVIQNISNPIGIDCVLRTLKQIRPEDILTIYEAYKEDFDNDTYRTPEQHAARKEKMETLDNVKTQVDSFLKMQNAPKEGDKAIDFTLSSNKDKLVSLSDIKGKYILIDFWASWCNPCREENPNVVKAYKMFKDKGFNIIGVSLDTKKEDWLKGIKDDGLTWTQVIDLEQKVSADYGAFSIPFSVLIDENGVIVAKNLRGEKLINKLNELLN